MKRLANALLFLQTRSFAAVIFRRIASKNRKLQNGESVELFLSLPQEQGYAIRQQLLEALGAETANPVRNKIGDAVAEIAREYSDGSGSSQVDLQPTPSLPWPLILTPCRGTMARNLGRSLHTQHLAGRWAA
jgi:hypothetical protein